MMRTHKSLAHALPGTLLWALQASHCDLVGKGIRVVAGEDTQGVIETAGIQRASQTGAVSGKTAQIFMCMERIDGQM